MKLTIGMIVKNEEKWLERCLTAIKPILDNVDSELIITDTGSTDRTVEIAKKFTDKVLHFEWCNDFSAARNTVFDIAQGDWFMVLDADDIFKSCDGIIEFFNSGEYKKYNSATYTILDYYKSGDELLFSEQRGHRLTKILPETKFVGPIHESLNTFGFPLCDINDIDEHYGYVYETDEDLERKFKRNSGLLLIQFEKEKENNPLIHFQLFEAYAGIGENDKAVEYLDSGIALSRKMKNILLINFYAAKANLFHSIGRYDDAIAVCEDYFRIDKDVRTSVMTSDKTIWVVWALSLTAQQKYNEAIEKYKSFFSAFEAVYSGRVKTLDAQFKQYRISSDQNFLFVFCNFLQVCISAGRIGTAAEYIEKMHPERYIFSKDLVTTYAILMNDIFALNGYQNVGMYMDRLNENGSKVFTNSLCNRMYADTHKDKIATSIAELGKNDKMLAAKSQIYSEFAAGKADADKIVKFAEKFGLQNNHDLFYILMNGREDISPLLLHNDFDPKRFAVLCCDYLAGFVKTAEQYTVINIGKDEALPVMAVFIQYIIKKQMQSGADVDMLIERYAECGSVYVSKFGMDALPPDIVSAVMMNNICEYRNRKMYKECFTEMKSAIDKCPDIAPIIARYKEIVFAEYEAAAAAPKQTEIDKLAAMIKSNIRTLIAKGNTAQAVKLLNEYAAINPNDPEIETFKNELN